MADSRSRRNPIALRIGAPNRQLLTHPFQYRPMFLQIQPMVNPAYNTAHTLLPPADLLNTIFYVLPPDFCHLFVKYPVKFKGTCLSF